MTKSDKSPYSSPYNSSSPGGGHSRRQVLKKIAIAGLSGAGVVTASKTADAQSIAALPDLMPKYSKNKQSEYIRIAATESQLLPNQRRDLVRLDAIVREISDNRIGLEIKTNVSSSNDLITMIGRGEIDGIYTNALFAWQKIPAAYFFAGAPFGLSSAEHIAWLQHGDGQILWNEAYSPLNLRPIAVTMSGDTIDGWFRRELTSVKDFKDLKIYASGLSTKILASLGATPVKIQKDRIYTALHSGLIDGVTSFGPSNGLTMKLYLATKNYYLPLMPGNNLVSALYLNNSSASAISESANNIITRASMVSLMESLSNNLWLDGKAISDLAKNYDLTAIAAPAEITNEAAKTATDIYSSIAAINVATARVVDSYMQAKVRLSAINTGN